MRGKVKFFKESNGYGFISVEGREKDVFVHISECPNKQPLKAGQEVAFDVVEDKKGCQAVDVSII